MDSSSSNSHLYPRQSTQSGLFADNTAYDRVAEFVLALLLAGDLLTLVASSKRASRFSAFGYFVGLHTYYFLVMLIHLHVFSTSINDTLGVTASLFWWTFATLIAYNEFAQFAAIMKAVRPNHRLIAEIPRVIVILGIFLCGLLLFLGYLSVYVSEPPIIDNLTLTNLIQCTVCIPRLFSTFWVLYVVRDIAMFSDGVIRKLGKGYVRISGIQILNSLVGLILLTPLLSNDARFISLISSVVEILLHYAICSMLAADLSDENTKPQSSAIVQLL
ncbi:hypothetical protein HK103_001827 [Boothiomyces macroporosus]|uniref:Uncharacterized protein n=1 Tax=Boothiomyces macroporosus TaxID=261099 RepID=A0AAD5UAW0_9FUNG|nr:hypothetical protein HK103_001827 [Boothiomyces macroporosus]